MSRKTTISYSDPRNYSGVGKVLDYLNSGSASLDEIASGTGLSSGNLRVKILPRMFRLGLLTKLTQATGAGKKTYYSLSAGEG